MHKLSLIFLEIFGAILLYSGAAHGASQTWNNSSGNFTWDTSSSNWSGASWTPGNDAVFGATGVGTITINGVQTVGTGSDTPFTFNTAGYTLTNGSLVLPSSGNTSTIAINASATIASLISGAGTFLKTGSGTLTLNPGLSSTNTVATLQTTAGNITLQSGTLNVTANGGVEGPGLYINGGTLTVAGGILNANAGPYATINNNGVLSISSGTCNVNNSAELLNGYGSTGTINLSGTGVLNVNILRISQGIGTVNLNGGTLQLNRFNTGNGIGTVNFNGSTVQAKSSLSNFIPLGYTYNVQSGGAVFNTAGYNITITAALAHDSTLGNITDGGLIKQGTGTLTLTGANTYSGPTTVNGGSLSLSQPTLSPASAVTLTANAILNLNFAGSNTVLSLMLGGVQMPAGTYNAASNPANFTGTGSLVNLNATNLLWTGTVNGNWDTTTPNWNKLGVAANWFNGANAVFGTAGVGVVNLTTPVKVNSLVFNGPGYTIAGNTLTLGTNLPNLIAYTNATVASVLTNTGGIAMSGGGTLTLSGANKFTGNLFVLNGNVVLNSQQALGFASATVTNNSQIYVNSSTTYTNALTLTGNGPANTSEGPSDGALHFHHSTATWSGLITLSGSACIGAYGSSGYYTLTGGIGGSGDLQIWAGGASAAHFSDFTISAPCSYNGNTFLNTYAAQPVVILSGGANLLPTNTVLNFLAGIFNGEALTATLQLNGNNQTVAGLVSGNGSMGGGGSNCVVNGSATAAILTINGSLNSFFDGYLGGPGANQNNFGLIKNGPAQFTVNRSCTCSGALNISAGLLNLAGGLNGGTVTVARGATILLGNGTNIVTGLVLNSGSTLGVNIGSTNNPNNTILQINGNLVLAGTILAQDLGNATQSNAITIINYTGNLTNLGMTTDPRSEWSIQVDVSTPGKVKLIPLSKLATFGFTTSNQTVSNSLQFQMQGVYNGFPTTPVYYEVHTPDNRLWDFGAVPPSTNWSIYLRHLRAGTNTVRAFALGNGLSWHQDIRQVVLQLGANPIVRPRPIPAEIWWGGVATGLAPDYGFSQLLDPSRLWNFVQQYQDGIYLHGYLPTTSTLQGLAAKVAPLGRFGQEASYYTKADPNYGVENAAIINATQSQLQNEGINISFHSFDYNPGMSIASAATDPSWCENWPNWTHDQLLNTNMNCWNNFVAILHTNWPGLKLGMTWSPVYFNWSGYPCTLAPDSLILHPVLNDAGVAITNQYGTNAWFNFDWQEFFLKASATAQAGDGYYGFASDCPYDYFAQWANLGAQTTNQEKILAYEGWERTNGYFPTTICNYSHANSSDTNVWDQQYFTNSFDYMVLKQQLGGRTQKYLFESWYSGPYVWAPESDTNSFTGMVKLAIKYLKGIQDTNGDLEQLNLGVLAAGTTNIISVTNNGDVACLPAVTVAESGSDYLVARYYNNAGQEITAQITGTEGYCHTNLLQPGQSTTLSMVVAAVSGAGPSSTRSFTFEAFWNPQDPTGVVRSRQTVSISSSSIAGPPLPLAWYQLEGNANDSSGNGFNGLPSNINYVAGVVGAKAASFNGTNGSISIPLCISNDFSIAFWVQTSQVGGLPDWNNGNGLVDGEVAAQTNDFGVSLVGGKVGFGVGNPDTIINSTVAINDGQWHHVAATRASISGVMNLYVDGVWQAMANGPEGIRNLAPVLRFGCLQTGSNFFKGTLDDVRLYGSSLHGAQVAALATLTPANTGPSLLPITNSTLIAGQTLTITNVTTDPDVPPLSLAFSLITPPTGAVINASNGVFAWRPTIAQSPSTNAISVVVVDNGIPALSATQSFDVTVLHPISPMFTAPAFSNGVISFQIQGNYGPDYTIQTATNLAWPMMWQPLITTNAPLPFNFTDKTATNFQERFYRVLLGP